jgi:hypothetical protein
MGWPIYMCPKRLATDWWRVVELGGFKVERDATEREYAVAGSVIELGATVGVMSRLETREAESSASYPSIVMMCGGTKNERELGASLERTFLASGATLSHGRLFACRRLLRCPLTLARAWPRLLADGPTEITLSDGPFGAAAIENALMPYGCGSVLQSGTSVQVFVGPALDPDTGETTAYIAVDYDISRLQRSNKWKAEALAEYITDLFIAHGASDVNRY